MQLIIEDVYQTFGHEPWCYCEEDRLTPPEGTSQVLWVGTVTDDEEIIICQACGKDLSREQVEE